MRIMALDLGDKTIGIAISDALLLTAHSRPTLRRTGIEADLQRLKTLISENEVAEIVLGQPLHMDGRPSKQSEKTAAFGKILQEATQLPVRFWDERLTSFAAEQYLEEMGLNWRERRKHVDQVAAMLILQAYLDHRQQS